MKILRERVKRYVVGALAARIWTQGELPSKSDVAQVLLGKGTKSSLAKKLLLMAEGINAVEILDDGEGIVLYGDWP